MTTTFNPQTYNVDKQVPDSAGTATAYLCGVKANYYTLGVDSEVTLGDCAAARNPIYHTPSILQWAQEAGKDTGEWHRRANMRNIY